jgi:hypothetical protein
VGWIQKKQQQIERYFSHLYPLKVSLSFSMHESQISLIRWEVSDEFCPRMIVIDGLIMCVSTIANSHFSAP